jgi:flagellar biosynthesis protein FlhF
MSTDLEPRTYRGSDLDELLPKIREELGPDAIVLRQRDGLGGGIGGFFQKRCVEVVARRAAPRVNRYDEGGPAEVPDPVPPAPEPPAPAIQEIMRVASPFVEQLQAAQAQVQVPVEARPEEEFAPVPTADEPAVEPVRREPAPAAFEAPEPAPAAPAASAPSAPAASAPAASAPAASAPAAPAPAPAVPAPAATAPAPAAPAPAAPAPAAPAPSEVALPEAPATEPPPRAGAAAAHEGVLVAAGIAPALAAEIIGGTLSHAVPFAPKRPLKHLVRQGLAARIPLLPPPASGARTIAFVGAGGSGKTLCATRVAAAYDAASDLDVDLVELAAGQVPEPVSGLVLTVIDTPAVSPAAEADTRALARQLRRLGHCEVHVTVPATLSASAVRRLLDGLAPLKPTAIALTHLDEVDHAGPVIDEAIARGVALSYCSDADAVVRADPAALAARVLA